MTAQMTVSAASSTSVTAGPVSDHRAALTATRRPVTPPAPATPGRGSTDPAVSAAAASAVRVISTAQAGMPTATGTEATASAVRATATGHAFERAAARMTGGAAGPTQQARAARASTTGVAGHPCHTTQGAPPARADVPGPPQIWAEPGESHSAAGARGSTARRVTPSTAAPPAATGPATPRTTRAAGPASGRAHHPAVAIAAPQPAKASTRQ